MPGVWIYEVAQNYNENGNDISIKGGPLQRYSFEDLCPGATMPMDTISMFYDQTTDFELQPCSEKLKSWKSIEIRFVGTFEVDVDTYYDAANSKIEFEFPQMWGVNEPAKVMLVLDHVPMETGLTVRFTSPLQEASASDDVVLLEVVKTDTTLELTWPGLSIGSTGPDLELFPVESVSVPGMSFFSSLYSNPMKILANNKNKKNIFKTNKNLIAFCISW